MDGCRGDAGSCGYRPDALTVLQGSFDLLDTADGHGRTTDADAFHTTAVVGGLDPRRDDGAFTVTHILGVRAFGTQLLCEQVVGRGLRRQSYELNEEGKFNVEYADILGIPFDFAAKPVIAPPAKPRETVRVHAVRPERDALEIVFPRVEGYRVELPDTRLEAKFGPNSYLDLTPELVGPSKTENQGIVGEGVQLTMEHLEDMRPSTILYRLTHHLLYAKFRDPGEQPRLTLFGQLKRITKQWLDGGYLRCSGGTFPAQVTYLEIADMAAERIKAAITETLVGERPVKAILDPYNPTGSTSHVNFNTSKETRWKTDPRYSHVNWVVCDSDWEAEFCRIAESHPQVMAYVKNHNLGFEVPYLMGSKPKRYRPDFIVRIDDGGPEPLNLVVETKGYRREDAVVNPLDCAVGGLYRHLSQFADFAGITVNYSGNKSLHFHLVFQTALAAAQLGLGKATDARRGLIAHWDDLHAAVLDHLPLPTGVTADASLRLPEAYRRIPNGTRLIESDCHLLGIPAGMIVSQVTLWEKWVERAASGAEVLFFKPEPFFAAATSRSVSSGASGSRPRTAPSFRKVLSPEEMAYCEAKLAAFYPGYPKFEGLTFEGGRWVARFRNSAADRTPSSIMTGEHKRILLVGRDAAGLNSRELPFALGVMIRGWVAEFRRPKVAEWEDCDWAVETRRTAAPNAHEVAFAEAATDHDTASRQIRRFLRKAVLANDCSLICAPEGIRKTSSLFADHHRLQGTLEAQTGSTLSMYAFADYEAAAQKCAAFNAVQQQRRGGGSYLGIVLPSFSKAYEDACREVGVGPITSETAAGAGYANLWNAVEALQSTVLDSLKGRHRRMWDEIGPRKPVFFTVHDVAQRWTLTTPTRLMWAREFWIGRMDDPGHVRDCRRSTALALLVHDEVSFESLVVLHRAEAIEWVAGLKASEPKVWQGRRSNLASQFASYRRFVNAIPFPIVAGIPCSVSFNEAREIVGLGDVAWDEVEACWSGEYGPLSDDQTDDIYATRMGRRWRVAPRGWWRGAAERVVVLTTEAVPTEVARRMGGGWAVHELETPLLKRDWVDVYPQRGVTGGKLINVVSDYRREHSDACTVISNKVKALPGTITHQSARGSNAFIGQDLAQTMTFLTPDEVERLEALNAWTGRGDLIRLRHWDQFNQSCGRNLGFRKQGDVRHDLLIGHRLLECLLGAGLDRSRYDLRVHLSRAQRYAVRIKAA